MKAANLANEAMRTSEVGMVWEEKLTNAMGTIPVLPHQSFRVRATGATTVTIDGVLAMTMMAGEIAILCAGAGDPDDSVVTVNVVIAGAAAFVQVAREVNRPSLA